MTNIMKFISLTYAAKNLGNAEMWISFKFRKKVVAKIRSFTLI